MVVLDDFLRSARKFKVLVYLATQFLDLPPEIKACIFANCSRFFSFASSAADAAFLAKEFGGVEGALVADQLAELPPGKAFVKCRGEPVQLLRVVSPDLKISPELVEKGRSLCLRLGATREQIDRDIEERRRRYMHTARADTAAQEPGSGEHPEGYEGY